LDSTDVKLIQDLVQVPVFSLESNQVFQIQNTFGFIPLGELPVIAGPPGPSINLNVADYLRVINAYAGLPNYICKTAPVASHLNLNLLWYWAQGHHDIQVCDLLEFGFPEFGCGVKLFKIDLARAFRQLHVDPFDTKFLGLHWRGEYFLDLALPFGYRNGTLACTRVTDLIRFILAKLGIFVVNYINDIIGVAPDDVADAHFKVTLKVLHLLGFIISKNKTVPPGKIVTCLGIVINLELGCLSIPSSNLTKW
jgi:hypothetical protein